MKKILLIIFVLLLSGCTTQVTLKIDAEKVNETIEIYGLKSEIYSNNILNNDIKSNIEAFEREYEFYDMQEFEHNEYISKTYKLTETIELWSELSHLRPCYETFKLEKTETNISLETSNEYRCGYLFGANDVMLTVESDLHLISTNADKIVGNKLIWNINNNNYRNKSINFNYSITKFTDDTMDLIYEISIYLIIICSAIAIVLFVKKQNKKNNKI